MKKNHRGGACAPPVSAKRTYRENFGPVAYALFAALTLVTLVACVCIGSVNIPAGETAAVIAAAAKEVTRAIFDKSITVADAVGAVVPQSAWAAIILTVRLPRVLAVALVGAALSLGGAAMQGLLKNPLADGSTLGVSSGASLGAVIAIAFNITMPGLPFGATTVMAILFAFLSLILILSLAYKLDYSLATNTIILIGVIFSMFVSSVLSLIITMAPHKVQSITFWTMGSLSGASYSDVLVLLAALVVCGAFVGLRARELNAFAIGEDNARHIGVDVKQVKLVIMIAVSALIGVCVSVGGTIGFVGLVVPHMVRMITGPNHRRLLPACVFGGAAFLMLCDLTARILLNPLELPIGVVTSFIGAILFVVIFYQSRRARK